jgi:hypothetical protein
MRRRQAPSGRADALRQVEEMMRDGLGLRLLLAKMPAGATLDDARLLRKQILQRGRRPSRVLDATRGPDRA